MKILLNDFFAHDCEIETFPDSDIKLVRFDDYKALESSLLEKGVKRYNVIVFAGDFVAVLASAKCIHHLFEKFPILEQWSVYDRISLEDQRDA